MKPAFFIIPPELDGGSFGEVGGVVGQFARLGAGVASESKMKH